MASPEDRYWFDGVLVSILTFGALCMLYLQLIQVFISRPTRGRRFWALVVFSSVLFPLASITIGGFLRFTELSYVLHRDWDPQEYIHLHGGDSIHIMSQVCVTLIPWVGDLLILYRIWVVWNGCRFSIALPLLLYVAQGAMSIPFLVAQTSAKGSSWNNKVDLYATCFASLCISLNLVGTLSITARLIMQRKRVEQVMGRVHAAFYTGWTTIIVESGALFTIWGIIYVILLARDSPAEGIFLLPAPQIMSLTRMLIVLRMAQDRAWSPELARALERGRVESDWQVSSTLSIPLHDVPASTVGSLPSKFPDDASV